MIKLLIVSEVYPEPKKPQYGIFIKQQVDELKKLGYDIEVLMPYRSKTHVSLGKEGEVYKIGYKNFRYDIFPVLADKKAYEEIKNLISGNYDLVAVHITSDIILKMVIKACDEKIPVVAHYHGLNVWNEFESKHPYREKLYAFRRKEYLSHVNAVIGVSDKVTEIIRKELPKITVSTVYNGVDLQLFQPSTKDHSGFKIIGVGNLIRIKGFNYLIEAFKEAAKPDMELHIVGEGPEMDNLQRLAKDTPTYFHGKLPYKKVAEMVSNSDLFVLPSFYEALGCVYLEAMACGVATVGVKGMGIDEIIVDGVNGFLVEPKSKNDIIQVIKTAISQPEKMKEISKKAIETAEKFSWANSAENLDKVYKRVLDENQNFI